MIYGGSNKDGPPSSIVIWCIVLLITDTASRCITASEIGSDPYKFDWAPFLIPRLAKMEGFADES